MEQNSCRIESSTVPTPLWSPDVMLCMLLSPDTPRGYDNARHWSLGISCGYAGSAHGHRVPHCILSQSGHAKPPGNYFPDPLPIRTANHLWEALDRSESSRHRLMPPDQNPTPSPTVRLNASRHAKLWYLSEYPCHVHQSHAIQDESHQSHGRYDSRRTELGIPAIISTGRR